MDRPLTLVSYLLEVNKGLAVQQSDSHANLASNSESSAVEPLAEAQRLLLDIFGYREFRAGQQDILQQVLAGGDTLALLPTGAGKSLCYQLPALLFEGITLVVSPLVSLMDDQVAALNQLGIPAGALHSGLSPAEVQEVFRAVHQGDIKLLYLAPERLLQASFLNHLRAVRVSLIAIDEAHCISQWGHNFRPEYGRLGELRDVLPQVPVLALTATADTVTRHDIVERLRLHDVRLVQGSFDRPNIRYLVQEKYQARKQLLQYLQKQRGSTGIVYCNSRRRTEELAELLMRAGFRAAAYHARLPAEERSATLHGFLRDDIQVVVATVAFGMGINKPDVRFVVHFDLPRSVEAYYQETGRAGRDGIESEAVLFYEPRDADWIHRLFDEQDDTPQVRVERQKFQAMQAFAEAQTCRRIILLNYFGEYREKPCNNCDICLDPPRSFDATVEAQKALSCVYRTGQQFGINHQVEVLRGSKNQRLRELKHHELSTWGIGREHSAQFWTAVFRQLIHRGLLVQDIRRHGALCLTESARPVLRGEIALMLARPRLDEVSRTAALGEQGLHDKVLFKRLRALRKALAEADEIPPFRVFNDHTLKEMAILLPTTEQELLAVSGVAQKKLAQYGREFLAEINSYLATKH